MKSLLISLMIAYNTTLRFPPRDRALFYEILACQLAAGATLKGAFELLQRQIRISAEVSIAARAGYLAAAQGREAMSGLLECRLFPREEVLLLAIAERQSVLLPTLRRLREQHREPIGFSRSVLAPNAYFLTITAALVVMVLQAEGLLASLATTLPIETNPAYQLSHWLNRLLGPIAVVALVLGTLVGVGAQRWTGPKRRWLVFFARDVELQTGMRFCALSSAFYDIGASHTEILQAAMRIWPSGYMHTVLSAAHRRYAATGADYHQTLGETVLNPALAGTLGALTPDDQRRSHARAFQAVETLQRTVLRSRYDKTRLALQFALVTTIAWLLLTMLIGIYSLYA